MANIIIEKHLVNDYLKTLLSKEYQFNITTSENEATFDNSRELVKKIIKEKNDIDLIQSSIEFSKNKENTYYFQINNIEEFIFNLEEEEIIYEIEDISSSINNEVNLDELLENRTNNFLELVGMYFYYSLKFLAQEEISLAKDGKIYLSRYENLQYLHHTKFNITIIEEDLDEEEEIEIEEGDK